jgi:hypothetical protein
MGKLATVIAAPIKGALGTEIQVGDTVMVVTTGYSHRVSVNKGKYVGYIEGTGYSRGQKKARIEVETTRTFQVKPDGTEFSWSKDYDSATWNEVRPTLTYKTEPCTRKSTLNLNRIATIKESDFGIVEHVGKLV